MISLGEWLVVTGEYTGIPIEIWLTFIGEGAILIPSPTPSIFQSKFNSNLRMWQFEFEKQFENEDDFVGFMT